MSGMPEVRSLSLWARVLRLAAGLLILLFAGTTLTVQLARHSGPLDQPGRPMVERPLTRVPSPAYLPVVEAKARHEAENPTVPWSGFLTLLSPRDRWKLRDLGDSNPPLALTAEERTARERALFWRLVLSLGQSRDPAEEPAAG